jgi:hypothetical protein
VPKPETLARAESAQGPQGFTGPLFVVGMHRSGTKLLRDLLRGHSRIRIPTAGTQFLPRWVREWDRFGDLSDRKRFSRFYRWNRRTPYFLYLDAQPGGTIAEEEWYRACSSFKPSDIFEALLRHDVGAPAGSDLIWGDRSPDYITQVDLLADLFPDGRVIHIVRDARDRCLSIQRRNGANLARAAQRWSDGVLKARQDGERLGSRYLEVRYEDLTAHPERELRRCCELLGVEYEDSLDELKYAAEHTGDARGARHVVSGNTQKYDILGPAGVRSIEEIAADALRAFGYRVEYSGPVRRVSPARMRWYRLTDGVRYVVRESPRHGAFRNLHLQLGRLTRN